MLVDVDGYCPMGCGRTLHATSSTGLIACLDPNCPMTTSVSALLADKNIDKHLVRFLPDNYDIQHPLRERINNELLNCPLHLYIGSQLAGPPDNRIGVYTALEVDGVWEFTWLHENGG